MGACTPDTGDKHVMRLPEDVDFVQLAMDLTDACTNRNSLLNFVAELVERGCALQFNRVAMENFAVQKLPNYKESRPGKDAENQLAPKSLEENCSISVPHPDKSMPQDICAALFSRQNCVLWSISPPEEDANFLVASIRYLTL